MRLLTIETAEEANCLAKHFESSKLKLKMCGFFYFFFSEYYSSISWWLDASDKEVEGKFQWCSWNGGEPFQTSQTIPWRTDEPSDKNHSENCLELEGRGATLFLNDQKCGKKVRYICEVKQILVLERRIFDHRSLVRVQLFCPDRSRLRTRCPVSVAWNGARLNPVSWQEYSNHNICMKNVFFCRFKTQTMG